MNYRQKRVKWNHLKRTKTKVMREEHKRKKEREYKEIKMWTMC